MTASPGLFVARDPGDNGTTPAAARNALAGLLAKNPDGTVRTGVLADGLGPVVTGTFGMSYSVRKHVAVTKAAEINGPTLVPNDGPVTVSTTPAPGSNSRIDVIYVQQRFVQGDGGSESTNQPVIGVLQGATSATPSAPSLPTGAVELGRATVTAGTTATFGLTFKPGQWTVANGGSLPRADGVIDTGWIAPSMQNSWDNFGSPYASVAWRYRQGVVSLKGMVKSGTSTIFQLPEGCRPAATLRWDVSASGGQASVDVGPTGLVVVAAYKGGGDNTAVSLSAIRFDAEQ